MLLIFQRVLQVNIMTEKNYLMCYHRSEFGNNVKWVFFATSHEKQPCDRVGSTVKRLTRLTSLGGATSDQTPTAIFNFCEDNIEIINLIYLSKDKVDTTAKFAKRFNNIKTILGKRLFHEFVPITTNEIGVKFCSEDQDICHTHSFGNDASVPESLNLIKSYSMYAVLIAKIFGLA